MSSFENIKEALEYIDNHLDEPMSIETLARRFHFSPYYFHRMFSVITGKTIAAHIRDRRLMLACVRLAQTGETVLSIALACGYNSAQSFSRAFRALYGMPPGQYRKKKIIPEIITIDDMIMKFASRLKGGVYLNPKIIKRKAITIAGTFGDGNNTAQVWSEFERLISASPLKNRLCDNGYEIRLYEGGSSLVYTGFAVSRRPDDTAYKVFTLPASQYAVFDVYVASGYESGNDAIDEWLRVNKQGYAQKMLGNAHYCVEYYDERFNGSEAGSIVEIWVPVEKKG